VDVADVRAKPADGDENVHANRGEGAMAKANAVVLAQRRENRGEPHV
jgi:hypothetical protein